MSGPDQSTDTHMVLSIRIPNDAARRIMAALAALPQNDANTHGPLKIATLAEMLMEDVDLSICRPDSWEGSHMGDVLASHGYEWT